MKVEFGVTILPESGNTIVAFRTKAVTALIPRENKQTGNQTRCCFPTHQ